MDAVEFGLRIETSDADLSAVGVLRGDTFRMVLEGEGEGEAIDGAANATPLQLAILVDLGPRPAPAKDTPVLMAEGLTSLDRADLLAAWPAELREGTPLANDEALVWNAFATWPVGPGEEAVRTLTVIDGVSDGIAFVELADDGAVLVRPCTSTDVWIALAGLLPYRFELLGHGPC